MTWVLTLVCWGLRLAEARPLDDGINNRLSVGNSLEFEMAFPRIALALSACIFMSASTMADEAPADTDLEAALKKAKKTGKPVFVYAFDSV